MQFYLIRHPQPLIASGVCYGQSDLDVSEQECQSVLRQLDGRLPSGITVFFSPLRRCAKLAQLLHESPIADARLMEMYFGRWEMQSWDAIARPEIDAWAADVPAYAPGGGESVVTMAARIIDFLADLAKKNLHEAAIVAHAGSIRLMLAYQPGMQASDLAQFVVEESRSVQFGECIKHQINLC
jgi:alpha-ribazole phosphatase